MNRICILGANSLIGQHLLIALSPLDKSDRLDVNLNVSLHLQQKINVWNLKEKFVCRLGGLLMGSQCF